MYVAQGCNCGRSKNIGMLKLYRSLFILSGHEVLSTMSISAAAILFQAAVLVHMLFELHPTVWQFSTTAHLRSDHRMFSVLQ